MSKLLDSLKQFDEKISYKCFRAVPKTKKWKTILKSFEYSCNGIAWLTITLILIYLNPDFKPYSYLLGGLVLDIVYVALLKAWARRRRPTYARQDDQLLLLSDKHSFPSGHATRAIYVALFTHLFFKNLVLTTLFFIWALSVVACRILLGRHHLFDVVCGCLIGYLEYLFQFTILKFMNPIFFSLVLNVFASSNTNDMDDASLDFD